MDRKLTDTDRCHNPTNCAIGSRSSEDGIDIKPSVSDNDKSSIMETSPTSGSRNELDNEESEEFQRTMIIHETTSDFSESTEGKHNDLVSEINSFMTKSHAKDSGKEAGQEESDEFQQTMIIHDTISDIGQAAEQSCQTGTDPSTKTSKELASDEVISDSDVAKALSGANDNEPAGGSNDRPKQNFSNRHDVVRPKSVSLKNNQPVYIEKYASYDIYTPKTYTNDTPEKHTIERKFGKKANFENLPYGITSSDNRVYIDSFSILDDLEQYGAVGGKNDAVASTSKQDECPTPSQEPLSSIMHRKSPLGRKSSSVHFDDRVDIETFSQSEPPSDCSKAVLAKGDGPVQEHEPTIGPFLPPLSMAGLNDIGGTTPHDNTGQDRMVHYTQPSTANSHSNPFDSVPFKDVILPRKGSTPRQVSPTELLRIKQRKVADKIIKSLKRNDLENAPDNHMQYVQPDSSSFRDCQRNEQNTQEVSKGNYKEKIKPELENRIQLLRVNSSEYVDPKHLTKFPDIPHTSDIYDTYLKELEPVQDNEESDVSNAGKDCYTKKEDSFNQKKNKNEPGYWFFKSSDSSCSGSFDSSLDKQTPANFDNIVESTAIQGRNIKAKSNDKKMKDKKILERCRKKRRLDELRQLTLEHSQSDLQIPEDSPATSTQEDTVDETSFGYNSTVEGTADKLGYYDFIGEANQSPENDILLHNDEVQVTVDYMNSLLKDFLQRIKSKKEKNIPITADDFRELELIQTTILSISNILASLCVTQNDTIQESEPDQKHIDSHDRHVIQRHLQRLQTCLKNSEEDLQYLYNSSVNDYTSESNRAYQEMMNERKPTSEKTQICQNLAGEETQSIKCEEVTSEIQGEDETMQEEMSSSEHDFFHNDRVRRTIIYMNSLLTNFVNMIKLKKENGIPITMDDYRELELIQTTVLTVSNRLSSIEEPIDASTTSTDSLSESIQVDGTDQIHIDSHDKHVIQRHLQRIQTCLKNTEEDLKSLYDFSLDGCTSEHNRVYKEMEDDRQTTSERTQFCEIQQGEETQSLNHQEFSPERQEEDETNQEEVSSSENDLFHNDQVRRTIHYMNSLLTDFVNMIKLKKENRIPITMDDYRELELIQTTVLTVSNRLSSVEDPLNASTTSVDSASESIQADGSDQIHIDCHDRGIIQRNLHKLKMALKNVEKSIHSMSSPTLNIAGTEGTKTCKEVLQGSNSVSDRAPLKDTLVKPRKDIKLPKEDLYLRSKDKVDSCESIDYSKYISSSSSGYLGDKSESEINMPDAYFRKQLDKQKDESKGRGSEESFQGKDIYRSSCSENEPSLDMSQSVSLKDFMSVSSLCSTRENDWSASPDSTEGFHPFTSCPDNQAKAYPGFLWSKIAPGNAVNADCIYPGFYLAENDGARLARGLSTEPQVDSENDLTTSSVSLTCNQYFNECSSSEYENDGSDDSYEDTQRSEMEMKPTPLTVPRHEKATPCENVTTEQSFQEGSPDRGQRLYGSSQNLDRRGDAGVVKRKQAGARSLTPDSRSIMMEREVNESQFRKLQMENSTLQTENKLLKEKNNRSQARISDLESQLAEAQEDLNALQENLNQEVSDLSARNKHEIEKGRDEMQTKILVLAKESEALKAEVSSLEKKLECAQRTTDMARHNSEKARTIDAYKLELSTMKEELNRVKALLEQSEKHLREEEDRHTETSKQVLKLTELKNALQQQSDAGGSGAIVDKQMKSLEMRLKVTEERLHSERSDRANNLSAVEEKLLTDNSKLQASEKDLKRQLQREKEKNRNLDHRVKQLREDNEKLRIALPFDESVLVADSHKYDIPYGSHSSQRAETLKNLSDDMNYILSQIEKQDGLSAGQEEQIICTLWNKRELAYKHLREYELQIEELKIHDNNNIVDGLKNLRDTYSQSEDKLRAMEEKMEDMQAQMLITDNTYKEQLSELVKERHEAFAKLKTAEDLLEAVRAENESLRKNITLSFSGGMSGQVHPSTGESFEALKQESVSLEGKVAILRRTNEKLEGELTTAKVQLDARNKALEDVNSELDLAYKRLQGEEIDDTKQIKIDKLTSQVINYQIELKSWTDRYNDMVTEKSKLETELSFLKKSTNPPKGRQQKMEQIGSKELMKLKDDLIEKESRLDSVTKQLEDTDHELQRVRQELYGEQMHTSELEEELETLQHTANQRAQMFEALSGSEREQLAQYQILKETLDAVNQELAQKQAQIISLDVNLSGQRDRTVELEHEVEQLRREKRDSDEIYTEDEQNSAHQLRIGVLEQERSQLKQELSQAYSAIQAAEEQYRTLQTETSQIEQELVKEKTIILQITAEKGEIEQHLEELAEEHDALIQEKNQVEEDLIKLETKLQEILQKYEAESKKQHSDFTKQYPTLPPEGRKLVSELDSLRLVVEGKNREIEMLTDKLSRGNMEIEFLNRKVELVHNDSISNREDVARMISELTLKMKEAVSTREVNQYLVEERTKLQNQKTHLERELEQERKTNDDRKKEITDVIRKIERTETHKKSVEKDSKDKAGTIVSLEAELSSSQHSLNEVQSENNQLKTKLEHLNHDLKNLTTVNESLEKHLEMEKGTLSEEKSSLSKLQDEYATLSRDFQVLQHDHKVLCDKYETELKNVDSLSRDLEVVKREKSEIKGELETLKIELDGQKGQLVITKESVQKLTHDKGSIHQDYESMCRTLTEKERQLNELKARSEEKLELVQREHAQETRRLEEHKHSAVQECEAMRKELESVNEQLKQKEIQLSTFGKTLQELEAVTREKKAIESQFQRLESSSGDSKLLLEGQRKEIMTLNESLAKLQKKTIHIESENYSLESQLKSEKENSNREIRELQLMVKELKSQHENERHYLNENLSQTQNRLRSVETSLASTATERDQLNGHQKIKERTIEDLKAQLSDETTGRALAEKSVGTLRLQLDDAKNAKNVAEARFTEMQTQLNKAETQYKTEQEKNHQLMSKVQELQAVTHTTETSVRAKSEHLDSLQKETMRLKQLIDSQKQSHLGKMKKSALEFKQQLDLAQEEKDKLAVQVQQIAADLDACREHLAIKNKENLKLQEQALTLEDSLRESKTKQKHSEDTLKIELEKQEQLTSSSVLGLIVDEERFRDQDEELKRLRNFLAKKVEESGDADKSMWHDMNRVIQELSKQMANHLDAQKAGGGAKDGEGQSLVRFKKQIAELQGELNTEKSLHQITKTSLQALEEDCQRLRHQLQMWRKRDPHSSEKSDSPTNSEGKYKNRMEAINAIIAKSQSQAQALLASGGYLGNSMYSPRGQPNRAGYGSPQHHDSPDNSYSEDLSIASLPPLHYGSPTKYP